MNCDVKDCKVTEDQKPMCFRGENYCSEAHRKQLAGESNPNPDGTKNEVVE